MLKDGLERQKLLRQLASMSLEDIADGILKKNAQISYYNAILNRRPDFFDAVEGAVMRVLAKHDGTIPEQAKDGQFIVSVSLTPGTDKCELYVYVHAKRGASMRVEGGDEGALIKRVVGAIEGLGWQRTRGDFAKGSKRIHENLWEGRFDLGAATD